MKALHDFMAKYFRKATTAPTVSTCSATAVAPGAGRRCSSSAATISPRENVMKQAASLKDFQLGELLPGIKVNTVAERLRADRAAAVDAVQGRDAGSCFGDVDRATPAS